MSGISLISFLICFIVIIFSYKKGRDLFSPSRVFIIVWALAIGLAELKFSRLQHLWNSYEWIVLFIGIAAFLLGTFVIYVINLHNGQLSLNEIRAYFSSEAMIEKKKFSKVLQVLFLVYIISFLGNYIIEGYLPVFHVQAGQSRMFWGVFGIGLTVHIATPLILLTVEYIIQTKPRTLFKFLLIVMIIVVVITYLTLLQRFNMIFAIVATITFLHYASDFLKLRNIFLAVVTLFGLMYSVLFLRISSFALGYLHSISQMKFSIKYAIFTEPYMYVVMNLENLVRAISKLENHTWGYYTFHFTLSIFGIRKNVSEYLNLNDFPFLNSSYNTYSMFWDYYRDFGFVGLGLIPFILGFISSGVYYRMRMNPSLTNVSAYAIIIFIISISFFVNTIGLLHFIFNCSLIILLTKIVQKKRNTK